MCKIIFGFDKISGSGGTLYTINWSYSPVCLRNAETVDYCTYSCAIFIIRHQIIGSLAPFGGDRFQVFDLLEC